MIRKQGCQSICDARANLAIDAGGKLLICFMVCKKQKRPKRGVFIEQMAEWTGLEPATPGVTGRYSNQLNYHSW